ncbi:OPT protein, partial [Crypturellus undulatus]|nr:OPT protein [Crypturellus undulatus]
CPRRSRMGRLVVLAIAGLLVAAWAAEEGARKEEKPQDDPAAYENLYLDNYELPLDHYGDTVDLSSYEELYDYGDLAPRIEVGTLAPRSKAQEAPADPGTTAGTLELQPPSPSGPPVPPAPVTAGGPPGCRRCLCLGTSAYCDDAGLERVPPLPPHTAYLYARFNRIGHVRAADFAGLPQLKRIDLSSNSISRADADAFRLLPRLQELLLPGNRLTALPELPRSLVRLDARLNSIPSAGLRPDAFRDLTQLQFLHLSDNELDSIPVPLPQSLRSLHLQQNNNIRSLREDTFCDSRDHGHVRRALEDIRLDGNPINLSLFPDAYFCLPRLPTGRFH